MAHAAESQIPTIPGAPVPRMSAAGASEASAVHDLLAELRQLVKTAAPAAAMSAELTMTRQSAKRRGAAAIVSTVAAITYAVIDVFAGRQAQGVEENRERIEVVEKKVDAIAADVATIAAAVRGRD